MRKSALKTAAILLSLYASFVQALGVGGIDTSSALNEPLNARIELKDTEGLRSDELIVRLASVADFEATGIEYASFLSDFEFAVEESDGKRPIAIKITSPKTVREPYVNFLINISWPNGRLVKEYTILLDPVFGDSNLVSYNQNIAQQVRSATEPDSELPSGNGSGSRQYSNRLNGDGDTPTSVTVLRNDTMWEIAARVAPSGASVHQTMHAIKAVNPDAFINSNINRVKAGYVLTVPSADEITAINRSAAVQATQRDLQLWTGDKAAPRNAVARVSQQPKGELTLAAASDASASDAAALETISALKSENKELDGRLASLEKQLSDMNRLLQLKNAQLALIQEQGAAAIDEAALAADTVAAQVVEAQVAEVAETTETSAPSGVTPEPAKTAEAASNPAQNTIAEMSALRGNMPQPIEAATPMWANPVVQLVILALLLAALGAAFWLNRKKDQALTVDLEDSDVDLNDIEEDDFGSISDDVEFAEEPVSNSQLKVLEDEYEDSSYEDIVSDVESRLASQPHRADLQLFLLQQSAHNDDKETYVEHFKAFEAIGKPEDISKAKNLLVAIKGSLFWLEEDQTIIQTPVFGDLEPEPENGDDDGDEFFKGIVQETELTDEIAALLDASDGAESLDQAEADGFDETLSMSAVADDEGLDFTIGTTDSTEADEPVSEESASSDDDELDFDLGGFDLPEETSEDAAPVVDESDELDFEATLETDSVSIDTSEAAESDLGDLDIDGLDFGLDDMSAEADTADATGPEVGETDLLDDLGDLDFSAEDSDSALETLDAEDALDIDMGSLETSDVAEQEDAVESSSDEDLDGLDELFDDFDLSAASSSDSDAQVINDAEGPEDDEDDLSALLEGMDVESSEPEVVATPSEPEEPEDSKGIEGDIIDLSEFLDDSDAMTFDAGEIEETPEDDNVGIVAGSDDFDDLDDLSNLLDGLDADLDVAEEMQTKLGMAEAFIEMGDAASAKDALNEVIDSGEAHHRESARSLLAKLGA